MPNANYSWFLMINAKLLFICFVALIGSSVADNDEKHSSELFDEITASVPVLIAENGYTVEIHHVTTEDGYILEMHRIPATPTSPASDDKPVAFLMHGLLAASADWIIMGPGKSLGYVMADAGYDVWLGNARGNTYSKNHTTITDLSSKEFWDFTWHEIGYYDLPAMIDYALEATGQDQVIYIGHSQGTTSFYVMASQRTDYNDKIKVMFSLAPIAYLGNVISPLVRAAAAVLDIAEVILVGLLHEYEFLPKSTLFTLAESLACNDAAVTQEVCSSILFIIGGFDMAQLNTTMLPVILGHFPAGASTRQLIHYGQEINSKKFRKYDYGRISNLVRYGSVTPPNYKLSLVTAPVHLVCSGNDWLSALKDVAQLNSELGNPIEMIRVSDESWNHFDYVYGINATEFVYDPMLATMKESYSD